MGSAMMGTAWWREAWSDRIDRSDCFNFRMGFGLARCPFLSQVILEYGSKGIWVDMMIESYVRSCLDDDRWIKDGNPWRIGVGV